MACGHNVKFRERVVAAHAAGKGGVHTLAEIFGIGYRTVQRWLARQRTTGSVAPAPGAGGWKSPVDATVLTTLIRAAPDSTAAELCGSTTGASTGATGPAWRPSGGRASDWGSCGKKTPTAK
jgi:transposase